MARSGQRIHFGSDNKLGSRHIERVIDQRLHAFDESYHMRQGGVILEGSFVCPARVDVEQLRISSRTKGVDAQAAHFQAGGRQNVAQRLRDSTLITCAGVKTSEDIQRHRSPPSTRPLLTLTCRVKLRSS